MKIVKDKKMVQKDVVRLIHDNELLAKKLHNAVGYILNDWHDITDKRKFIKETNLLLKKCGFEWPSV